jgi:hypothetical protein
MSMFGDISLGLVLFAVGVFLIFIGMPKRGVTPRYLRFDAALVVYPAIILAFLAFGVAMMFMSHG